MFFADTKYLGGGYCPCSQEKITKCVQMKIKTGALTTCGDAFSFEMRVVSEIVQYEKPKTMVFPRWKNKDKRSYDHLKYVRRAIQKQSPNIAFTVEATCFRDDRNEKGFGHASVENGYIILVNVPKSHSQMIYADFAKFGIPFKNKLLSNYTPLIKQIVQFDSNHIINRKPATYYFDEGVLNPSLMNGYANYFFVSPSGMEDTYNDYSTGIPVLFRNFGMSVLGNIYECYGFALALVEIYCPIWAEYGELIITYELNERYNEEGILVRFGVRKHKPSLKAW